MADDLLWAYCVVPAGVPVPADFPGVEPGRPVRQVEDAGLSALVSSVPRAEYGADALRLNLNRLEWLERVARAHEDVLEQVLGRTTLVPLRLCTLFEGEQGVVEMLRREREAFGDSLAALAGREEWSVKLLVDPGALGRAVAAADPELAALAEPPDGRTDGGAYLQRRRLERRLRETTRSASASLAEDLRARIDRCAIDVVTRPPQNRELSHHAGEMLLNAACLIDAGAIGDLRSELTQFETAHSHLGVATELSGPWPPYNFADRRHTEVHA